MFPAMVHLFCFCYFSVINLKFGGYMPVFNCSNNISRSDILQLIIITLVIACLILI